MKNFSELRTAYNQNMRKQGNIYLRTVEIKAVDNILEYITSEYYKNKYENIIMYLNSNKRLVSKKLNESMFKIQQTQENIYDSVCEMMSTRNIGQLSDEKYKAYISKLALNLSLNNYHIQQAEKIIEKTNTNLIGKIKHGFSNTVEMLKNFDRYATQTDMNHTLIFTLLSVFTANPIFMIPIYFRAKDRNRYVLKVKDILDNNFFNDKDSELNEVLNTMEVELDLFVEIEKELNYKYNLMKNKGKNKNDFSDYFQDVFEKADKEKNDFKNTLIKNEIEQHEEFFEPYSEKVDFEITAPKHSTDALKNYLKYQSVSKSVLLKHNLPNLEKLNDKVSNVINYITRYYSNSDKNKEEQIQKFYTTLEKITDILNKYLKEDSTERLSEIINNQLEGIILEIDENILNVLESKVKHHQKGMLDLINMEYDSLASIKKVDSTINDNLIEDNNEKTIDTQTIFEEVKNKKSKEETILLEKLKEQIKFTS